MVNPSQGASEALVQVRWADMDVNRHVNNVQVARLFEEGRVRILREWFTPDMPGTGAAHVARLEIEFVAPMYYTPEPATVRLWTSRVGTSSFDLGSELRDGHGNVVAYCEMTTVTVDADSGQSRPFAADTRDFLQSKLGEPVPLRRRA
ncbi:thioesterase family protein [Nocardia sp. 348MFTsu5.1]|uniref:acyl-CoA thioesterase n=1 Tax=Nocardia sp. 348MFTsu5.1 TaxID=1172185 RepID=UPI00037B8191|nr:acyl-CoA thioesterase [Nocardia sp. 348MFTsu5.1]